MCQKGRWNKPRRMKRMRSGKKRRPGGIQSRQWRTQLKKREDAWCWRPNFEKWRRYSTHRGRHKHKRHQSASSLAPLFFRLSCVNFYIFASLLITFFRSLSQMMSILQLVPVFHLHLISSNNSYFIWLLCLELNVLPEHHFHQILHLKTMPSVYDQVLPEE